MADHATEARPYDEVYERNAATKRRYVELSEQLARTREAGESTVKLDVELDTLASRFVTDNYGLAVSLARRFMSVGQVEDYLAAAVSGLWEAFTKWDPDAGTTFGAFSRQYIAGRLKREVASFEHAGLSYDDFSGRSDVLRAQARLRQQLERDATLDELVEATGYTRSRVRRIVEHQRPTSIDSSNGDDSRTLADTLADTLVDLDPASDEHAGVVDALRQLPADELFVLAARYGLLHDREVARYQLGDLLGLTREVVRQIELRGLERLTTRLAG
jgi:RNA polymerase nonessential primary-like sigma factor